MSRILHIDPTTNVCTVAVSDDALAAKLDQARADMANQIAEKEAKLQAELA